MRTITARQLTSFAAVAALSVGTRVLPGAAASANQMGLLLAVASLPAALLLMWMLGKLYKDYPGMGLADIFIRVFGKFFGKVILLLIGIIVPFIMLAFTVRLHADRFASTVFSESPSIFFLTLTLVVAVYIARRGVHHAVRLGAIFAPVLIVVIAAIFFMALGDFKVGNLLPLSPDDLKPLGFAVPYALIMPVILILGNLLSDAVGDKENLAREGMRANIWLSAGITAVIAVCFGLLGSGLTERSTSPIYSAVKALNVPGIFERVDAFTVVLWLFADIAEIVLLCLVIIGTAGKLVKVGAQEKFAVPLGILTLVAAICLGTSKFRVLWTEKAVFMSLYVAGVLAIFLAVFLWGRARKLTKGK